jgi:hypothetical protein
MDDYDWQEAFACAGDPAGGNNSADVRPALPTSDVSLAPFGRSDVKEVFAMQEGENDERDWTCFGQLNDGRYFFLSAGCDYTVWDCQSGGCAFVSNDRAELLQFGMTKEQRAELGIQDVAHD